MLSFPSLRWALLGLFLLALTAGRGHAAVQRYELVATQASVNLSGKKEVDFALLVNGRLPAPTLTFTEGDEAEITVVNRVPAQEISIHWHGLLLPPEMDGVPYVNSPPIPSGGSFVFRFPLRQSGTYWYHTHTSVQEQKGLYGAIVIQPKKKRIPVDREAVLLLSDWSDEDALNILANLRKDGDYYLFKKQTVRSWWGAYQAGALGIYLGNEWSRMGGMDYSDVGYDAFLSNGQVQTQLAAAKAGERVRIRIINGSASTYFQLALGQGPLQVIAADGVDVAPTRAQEILIGMAETYDLLFEVPADRNYELRATAQDGTGATSAWIGNEKAEKVNAPLRQPPPLYEAMNHAGMDHAAHSGMNHAAPAAGGAEHSAPAAGGAEHSAHAGMDHSAHSGMNHAAPAAVGTDHSAHAGMNHAAPAAEGGTVPLLTVDQLQAREPSAFTEQGPVHDVKLALDGDMERYVWHINGKAIFEDRTITIAEGEIVRFTLENKTMMHHPMHLHGHFFRVLNAFGDRSPWKHTVDVPPHMTRTIEFKADEPGEWMLHCHNLYHMKTGMARVVRYSSYSPSPQMVELQKKDPHLHDHFYTHTLLEAATNHAQAKFRLMQTWNELDLRLETRKDYSWDLEGDLFYRRWTGNFFNWVVGASSFDHESYGVAGFSAILPLLFETTVLLNHKGEPRLDLEKRFQWTSTLFTDVDVSWRQKFKSEWEISLMYADSWAWAAGFKFTEDSVGVGVQYQF